MKKQIKKLSLNKKTISNLNEMEMSKHVGGASVTATCIECKPGNTYNGNTCRFHKTCYYC